jgi:hypothetical protein
MLDAIGKGFRCAISEQNGRLNEINDLRQIRGNAMVRRSSFGQRASQNCFWG